MALQSLYSAELSCRTSDLSNTSLIHEPRLRPVSPSFFVQRDGSINVWYYLSKLEWWCTWNHNESQLRRRYQLHGHRVGWPKWGLATPSVKGGNSPTETKLWELGSNPHQVKQKKNFTYWNKIIWNRKVWKRNMIEHVTELIYQYGLVDWGLSVWHAHKLASRAEGSGVMGPRCGSHSLEASNIHR